MFHKDEAMDAMITQLWMPMINGKMAPLFPPNDAIQNWSWTAYQELRKAHNQWKFTNDTIVIPYFVVPRDQTLTWIFTPDGDNPLPIWFSGAADVFSNVDFPVEPSINIARINYQGNTQMEWTYPGHAKSGDPQMNLSIDISGAAGVNADISLKTINIDATVNKCNILNPGDEKGCDVLAHNGGKCPTAGAWTSEKTNMATHLKYCAPPEQSDDNPLNIEIVKQTNEQCGLAGDCATCPTGEDKCKLNLLYPHVPATDLCYAQNYASRFGCNQWWDNKMNAPAMAWKAWFTNKGGKGGSCNSYSWPYGELEIKNPPVNGKLVDPFPPFATGAEWAASNEFACATTGKPKPGGSTCTGKLVQVDSSGSHQTSPLLACQTYPANAIIVFNVQYIKTTKVT